MFTTAFDTLCCIEVCPEFSKVHLENNIINTANPLYLILDIIRFCGNMEYVKRLKVQYARKY